MKQSIIKLLEEAGVNKEVAENNLEVPKESTLGDYAFPCFSLAKEFKKNPVEIAKNLVSKIKSPDLEKVEANGPYVNFFINRSSLVQNVIKKIVKEKGNYGSSKGGKGKKIVIDLSAPNIAKPFGIGHLRSTIIGNSISNLASFQGYRPIKINYLGDWGTQFGKLITAYKKWGDKKKLQTAPIKHLQELYVRINQDESLEQESRDWFRKLEEGNKEALKLWRDFRDLSLKEFDKIYSLLNVKFDVVSGESLYNGRMEAVVNMLSEKNLLKEDKGALIVDLTGYNLGVCLIKKSDGATLYATRDITAAIDRYNKYKFARMIYEVGSEQTLYFKQFFKVLDLAGFKWARNCVHVSHGFYLDSDGKRFSTRKGKTVLMEEVLNEALDLAKQELKKRYSDLEQKEVEKRARAIALAAIFYGDLKNYRASDAIFDIDRFISFEGDTGPYLLYAYARARNILRKANYKQPGRITVKSLDDLEKTLISQLGQFPQVALNAYEQYAPNLVANYAFQLSQAFNEFYHKNQVIGSEEENFRLILVDAFSQVLKNALNLLGIQVLEEM
ncbi:MAG: arginine--tRNA ligase [Nanoarchaeota archaeon]|nr:arginine--tRNA ligase [Nanoarchaeota archaeon]